MKVAVRKNNRLIGYDYSAEGLYSITICTHKRKNTLSDVVVGALREAPLRNRSLISKIVGYIKMNVSKRIHAISPDKKSVATQLF